MKLLHRRQRYGPRAGSALGIALMVVIAMAVLGTCMLQLHGSLTRRQVQSIDNKRAFYLAEAGLSEAVFGLSSGMTGNVATPEQPAAFGDGLFWVESNYLENGQTQLMSTGLCGGGRASLTIVVEKKSSSVASLGIFGDQLMQIQSGSTIDAYDSRSGAYPGPGVDRDAPLCRVGCNADIRVSGSSRAPTTIYGNVSPGPHGAVVATPSVTISGSTAPAAQSVALPIINVPPLDTLGNLSVTNPLLQTQLPGGDNRYDTLHIGSLGKLTIKGPKTLVASQLVVDAGGTLKFDSSGGPIKLYVTDYLHMATNSNIACTTKDPTGTSILVSAAATVDRDGDGIADPPVTFDPKGTLYGSIYAPFAPLSIGAAMPVFGSLAAQKIALTANASVHFDQALLAVEAATSGLPSLVAWRVVPLPNQPLVSLRIDPLAVLKLQGVTPLKPPLAQEVLDFKIDYVGLDGLRHTWQGNETKFNWGLVASVVKVLRLADVGFLIGL